MDTKASSAPGKFVIYGHRGACEYKPENTFSSFYLALEQGADGLETDIQLSKDGCPVLFHDDSLERATGIKGAVADYTLQELKRMLVFSKDRSCADRIITLEEFLLHFGHLDITLALELKAEGIEELLLELIDLYKVREKCIVTSFIYSSLVKVRELDSSVRVGFLTMAWDEDTQVRLKKIEACQVCLPAGLICEEIVKQVNSAGYSLRAWGVSDEGLMRRVVEAGVDGGMTVDFPDLLVKHMKSLKNAF